MYQRQPPIVKLLAASFLVFFIFPVRAELPKHVQIDKLKRIVINAQKQGDCQKLIKHMDQLAQFTSEIPESFYFFKGECSFRQGQYTKAIRILETFFSQVQRSHNYYDKALDVYMRSEEKQEALLAKQKKQKFESPLATPANEELKQLKVKTGLDFIAVAPGCFQMGSPADEFAMVLEEIRLSNEKQLLEQKKKSERKSERKIDMRKNSHQENDEKEHKVCLTRGYLLGKYEVTQAQWEAIMGSNPSHFNECGAKCPVEKVSWDDVQVYIKKLNEKTGERFRLPTEAEWEYAARSRTITPFSFGANINTSQVNYDGDHPFNSTIVGLDRKKPVPVGSLPANPWGFHEMHGNVWEWVQDRYRKDYYKNSPVNNPKGPAEGTSRIRRGGSWRFGARFCRSAFRGRFRHNGSSHTLGFRLARTL